MLPAGHLCTQQHANLHRSEVSSGGTLRAAYVMKKGPGIGWNCASAFLSLWGDIFPSEVKILVFRVRNNKYARFCPTRTLSGESVWLVSGVCPWSVSETTVWRLCNKVCVRVCVRLRVRAATWKRGQSCKAAQRKRSSAFLCGGHGERDSG